MSAIEKMPDGREVLESGPLQAAILADARAELANVRHEPAPHERGLQELADRIGWHERALRRVLHEQRVTLDLVDRYCVATERLLADLYPAVYAEIPEGFVWTCRKCKRTCDMDVLGEGKGRLWLRCRDCGRRQYLDKRKRVWGRWYQPMPVSTSDLARDYLAGATLYEVGKKHGMSAHGVRSRLIKVGIRLRPRGGQRGGAECLDRAREVLRQRSEQRGAEAYRLRRQGVRPAEVAQLLGMSTSGERRAYYAYRKKVEGQAS